MRAVFFLLAVAAAACTLAGADATAETCTGASPAPAVTIAPTFVVKEGNLDSFKEVARELVQLVKTQQPTGVLFYEWSFSDNYVFVEEGYTDVDAVAEHNLLVQSYLPKLLELATLESFRVHCNAADLESLKAAFAAGPAQFFVREFGVSSGGIPIA